ncbi:MAG TPA: NUDIX domain-containing protein [Egicoccus sp.]|nr:NUDIX domain-containing protein [Egicoccus sp.]HSK23490.1 NUDIX domain-containing protein [Egicoccus sp.]
MARSGHVAELRALVGTHRLLLPSVGTAVFDGVGPERQRLLLVRHADGTHRWGLPGGAVEPGEHPADAAVREVEEETGLTVELLAVAGVFGGPDAEIEYDNGDRTAYVTTVFVARPYGAGEITLAHDEIHDAAWFELDDLDATDLPDHARRMVSAAIAVQRDGAPAQFQPPG